MMDIEEMELTDRERAAYLMGYIDGIKLMQRVDMRRCPEEIKEKELDRLGLWYVERAGRALRWPTDDVCKTVIDTVTAALSAGGFFGERPLHEQN